MNEQSPDLADTTQDYYEVMHSPTVLDAHLDIESLKHTIQILAFMYKSGCSFFDFSKAEMQVPLTEIAMATYRALEPTENLKLNELRIITAIASVNIESLLKSPLSLLGAEPLTQMCVTRKLLKNIYKQYGFTYDSGTVLRTVRKLTDMEIIGHKDDMFGFTDIIYTNLKILVQKHPENFVKSAIDEIRESMEIIKEHEPDKLKEYVAAIPPCLYTALDL